MVNQILLNDTLQKINASLNKRFEKNADLYISKQDEYEIKKNLCNEAYGGIVDMAKAKGISHDIIVKVIMRNAGILNVKNVGKFKKELKPILENANYKALSYMMEDILGNNVYMQKKIRHILFSYYMAGITSVARINYWNSEIFEFDKTERSKLFELIIEKNQYKEPSKTLQFKIDFIIDAFEKYPSLMEYNAYIKLKITLEENELEKFFKYLCEEMEELSIDNDTYKFILTDAYATYGEKAFNDTISQIKFNSPKNFKQYINVICKLFRIEKDQNILVRMFDTICKVYESPYIKNHIKKEINKKVWKAAKINIDLYNERKVKIDRYMSLIERIDKAEYSSFLDILIELSNNVKPKSISYFWINMKTPDFEESILESFIERETYTCEEYLSTMHETYKWLFKHSIAKEKIEGLNKICERLAKPLHEFSSMNKSSDFFDTLDELWVDYVIEYKLQGKNIEKYMFKKYFERIKEWK